MGGTSPQMYHPPCATAHSVACEAYRDGCCSATSRHAGHRSLALLAYCPRARAGPNMAAHPTWATMRGAAVLQCWHNVFVLGQVLLERCFMREKRAAPTRWR